jgi:hypothetical protein
MFDRDIALSTVGAIAVTEHILAICEECGSAYAAKLIKDGRIRPIGRDTCSCGGTRFRTLK